MRQRVVVWVGMAILGTTVAAGAMAAPRDPNTAEVQAVDRFSDAAGMLMRVVPLN